ncbi:hypothetical protein JCM17960_22540 [Magnetospira thiophila]
MKILWTLLFAVLMSADAAAKPLEPVSIQFHWLPQFEFAGFYMAKEKGFYAEAGLEVTILPYERNKTDVVSAVISGRAQFGVGYSSLVADYFRGKPIVALAAVFQDSPLVLMGRDDDDMKTPEDLRGKRVMIGGDALDSASIMALLFSHGLLRNDIVRQDHSYDIEDLAQGRTDAMTAYVSNEPFHMRERGYGYRIFDPKENGISFYGDLLFSSEAQVRDHPKRTQAFVEASLEGWRYAFDHIDETIRLIQEKYNEQRKSYEALLYEANVLKTLAIKPGIPLGDLDYRKLEKASDAYRLMGIRLSDRPLAAFVWQDSLLAKAPLTFTEAERAFIQRTAITAATTTNWFPISFVDPETAVPLGIGHDFWMEIAKAAGLRVRVTPFKSFKAELDAVRDKTVDVIYSVGKTEDRLAYALFTNPYASFPISIVTSKDENFIPDPSYLSGRKIAVGNNFTAHGMMREAFPHLDYLPVKNVKEGLEAVSRGEAYAFVDILPVLSFSINHYGYTNLKISGETGLNFDLRIMVRDDYPQLVTVLNEVISRVSIEKRQEIFNRWINVKYEKGYDYVQYLPYFFAVLIFASLVFMWMFRAKRRAERAEKALTTKSQALEVTNSELHQTLIRLKQTNTELDSFAYVASHDLREPLRMISSYLELLIKRYGNQLDQDAHDYVGFAVGGAQRMDALIKGLLQYSRLQTAEGSLSEVDSEQVLEEALDNLEVSISESEGIVTFENLPRVVADRSQLIQLFQNLVGNALKYRSQERPPQIHISASTKDGMVTFCVQDNGIGMEARYFERIFLIFQRLHSREEYGGTGIGLAVCKKIVERNGGRIWVESTPGKGSSFFFTLFASES